MCACAPHVDSALGSQKGLWAPLELENFRWWQAAMWMLGVESRSSGRAASTLDH